MTTKNNQIPLPIEIAVEIHCCNCEDDITEETDNLEHESKTYCFNCWNDTVQLCNSCNETISKDDSIFVESDEVSICQSCLDAKYSKCDECDKYHHDNNINSDRNGHSVCDSCYEYYSTCSSCENFVHQDYSCYCSEENETYCESCHNEHYRTCHECNPELYDNDCDGDMSNHCDKLKRDGISAITPYATDVNWELIAEKIDLRSSPHFGFEIEIEAKSSSSLNNMAKIVGNHLHGHCMASKDGSLNNGFEIRMTPHKRQALKQRNIKKLINDLKTAGAISHDSKTCGFHIHIERTPFLCTEIKLPDSSLTTYAKLYQYLFNKLSTPITVFSKRTQEQINSYCQFTTGLRMAAVNLTGRNTIEIRIWNGTLKFERLHANYLFTLAIYDFLQITSPIFIYNNSADKILVEFNYWLESQPEYVYLARYLKAKNLMQPKAPRKLYTSMKKVKTKYASWVASGYVGPTPQSLTDLL